MTWLLMVWRVLRPLLGRSLRSWGEFASRDPTAAAALLDDAATILHGRAGAYRRQQGWRARRDRSLAASLTQHAQDLRMRARDETCPRDAYRDPGKDWGMYA